MQDSTERQINRAREVDDAIYGNNLAPQTDRGVEAETAIGGVLIADQKVSLPCEDTSNTSPVGRESASPNKRECGFAATSINPKKNPRYEYQILVEAWTPSSCAGS